MHPLVGVLVGLGGQWWGPAVRHAATWAVVLAAAVSVGSFAPEAAFVWALAGGPAPCGPGALRVPLDGEAVCVPARLAVRSRADLLVPPAFAGLAVGASACFVRALALGRGPDY